MTLIAISLIFVVIITSSLNGVLSKVINGVVYIQPRYSVGVINVLNWSDYFWVISDIINMLVKGEAQLFVIVMTCVA